MHAFTRELAQGVNPELYELDRILMVYVLAGTAILCLFVFGAGLIASRRDTARRSRLGGAVGLGELVIGLAVLGTVASLALPHFVDIPVVTTIIGALIGSMLGRPGRSPADRNQEPSE